MATPLADRHCVVCLPGTPTLGQEAINRRLEELQGWTVEDNRGRPELTKTFRFKGFMPGVQLVNKIADVAEQEGHHPDLQLSYGSLRVDLTTHAAGGLTDNDFILAAKIDRIAPPALRATSP
jgi:4a-hydroxytetrahydrobiopterin dehydratase